MSYTVQSDRLVGHDKGDIVTDADLEGANVPALIAAGHLKPQPKPTPAKKASS